MLIQSACSNCEKLLARIESLLAEIAMLKSSPDGRLTWNQRTIAASHKKSFDPKAQELLGDYGAEQCERAGLIVTWLSDLSKHAKKSQAAVADAIGVTKPALTHAKDPTKQAAIGAETFNRLRTYYYEQLPARKDIETTDPAPRFCAKRLMLALVHYKAKLQRDLPAIQTIVSSPHFFLVEVIVFSGWQPRACFDASLLSQLPEEVIRGSNCNMPGAVERALEEYGLDALLAFKVLEDFYDRRQRPA